MSSIIITCFLWVVVALTTKPEPEEVLIAFYKKAKPMGWWGPIAKKTGVDSGGLRPILIGLGTAVVGTTAVGGFIIALTNLYIGNWDVMVISGFISFIFSLFFKKLYQNHLNRNER